MDTALELHSGNLYLILAPRQLCRQLMNTFAARLALNGSLRVVDAGNWFDAHSIARQVRQQTTQLKQALERISITRAFTCYQVLSLLEGFPNSQEPTLVMNLLSTFADENVPELERSRLLEEVIGNLRRLSRHAPVVIGVVPESAEIFGQPHHISPLPTALLEILKDAANQVVRYTYPEGYVQGRLF